MSEPQGRQFEYFVSFYFIYANGDREFCSGSVVRHQKIKSIEDIREIEDGIKDILSEEAREIVYVVLINFNLLNESEKTDDKSNEPLINFSIRPDFSKILN